MQFALIIFRLFVLIFQWKFSSSPTVFVTAEHYRSNMKHDAASVWLEDLSASSFKICIRELQNFAGVHDDISVVRHFLVRRLTEFPWVMDQKHCEGWWRCGKSVRVHLRVASSKGASLIQFLSFN